jgi:hypothetical protein
MHERTVADTGVDRPRSRGAFLKGIGVGTAAATLGMAARSDNAMAMDPDLAAHEAATTDVHGIPDTSVLAKYTTAGTFAAQQTFQPQGDSIPVVLRAGGPSADLLRTYDSAGNIATSIDSGGYLLINHNGRGQIHSFINTAGPDHRAGAWIVSGENATDGGAWSIGVDTAAAIPYRDFFIGKVTAEGGATDVFYINHNGDKAPTVGIGWVPARGDYRLNVSGEDSDPSMGGLGIRVSTKLTSGKPIAFVDSSSGSPTVWMDAKYRWNSEGGVGFRINAARNNGNYPRTGLVLADSDGESNMFYFRHEASGALTFRSWPGSRDLYEAQTDSWRHMATKLSFFGAASRTKPTVSGSRRGNDALASLLSALSSLGLVTDQTTG